MGLTDTLTLEIDYGQERVVKDAQTVLAQGTYPGARQRVSGWDFALASATCWQDPVTMTLFPRPNVKDPLWNTSGAGDYARIRASALTFLTPAAWKEAVQSDANTGDYWHEADGLTADETVITNSAFAANTPMYVNGFRFDSSESRYVVVELGWADTIGLGSGVGMRFWSDDDVEVWKDGVYQASYKLGGDTGQRAGSQDFTGFMLLPCRKRELLVVSNAGTGFTHVFTDLDEDLEEPVIVPAAKFWLKFPVVAKRSGKFQVAQIKTSTSFTAYSRLLSFPDAPLEGAVPDTPLIYGNLYGGTLTATIADEPGTGVFVPDGTKQKCRVKVVAACPGTKMTGLYGAICGYPSEISAAHDSPFDITPWVYEAHLRLAESADSASLSLSVGRLDEVQQAWTDAGNIGDIGLKTQNNRPLRAKIGDALLMGARTGRPHLTLGYDDSVSTVEFDARDRWQALGDYVFRDIVPLDGIGFVDAIKYVVQRVIGGGPERFDIEDTDLVIPVGSSQSQGQWGFLIESGDRASDVLSRLMETFAADWIYGWVPTPTATVFRARSVSTLGLDPVVTLYLSASEAVAALISEGYAEEDAVKLVQYRTCRTFRQEVLPVEATEVRVTGQDARTGLPIAAYYVEDLLEDPSLAPGSRPDGWWGEKKIVGYCDGALNTQAVLEAATLQLANVLTVPRTLAEWECGLLFKENGDLVWKGDKVDIDGIGEFRVVSIEASFVKEPGTEDEGGFEKWSWRPAIYTGELVTADKDGWRARTPGAGIDEVSRAQRLATRRSARAVRGSENLLLLSPFSIVQVGP